MRWVRHFFITVTACASLVAVDGRAHAQEAATEAPLPAGWHRVAEGFGVQASLRLRGESKLEFDFNGDTDNSQSYLLEQIRVGLLYRPVAWLTLVVVGQDAHIFGESIENVPPIDDGVEPNIYADLIDVHLAHAIVSGKLSDVPISVTLGRQKLAFADERLIGPLEWVNTARVNDGARVTVGDPKTRSVDAFFVVLVPVDPEAFNFHPTENGNRYFDSSLAGVFYSDAALLSDVKLEGFWFLRYNGDDEVDDQVHTIGARATGTFGKLAAEAQFALQLGTFGGADHLAEMAYVGATYAVAPDHGVKTTLSYAFGSGDGDPMDDTHGTFDNLYPTNHLYYGAMDLFGLQNIHNPQLTVTGAVANLINLKLEVGGYWLAQPETDAWYNAGSGAMPRSGIGMEGVSSFVGTEIDLTVKAAVWDKRIGLMGGYSFFMPGGFISDTGPDDAAHFLYLQTAIKWP